MPINLASSQAGELAKPILFDCDYEYEPAEDARLTVKWFRNKEAEPFYQWLPELNVRHLADWIRPLVNQSFVSDPLEPMKRYRSLLIRRLSMNLTGQYTCLVSSLAGQDLRSGSLVVYQPPRALTLEHHIYPAVVSPLSSAPTPTSLPAQQPPAIGANLANLETASQWRPAEQPDQQRQLGARPTQFKVYSQPALIVRPANNDNQGSANNGSSSGQRVVYTHDGRPVWRPSPRSKRQADGWLLKKRLGQLGPDVGPTRQFMVQLHHVQCSASQVTPRPAIVLNVRRDADSIAQFLQESSQVSIRPYQVSWPDYLNAVSASGKKLRALKETWEGSPPSELISASNNGSQPSAVTLYDISVSTTVALNVSLAEVELGPVLASSRPATAEQLRASGINTVLAFRRGQRMSFECQLDITGTDFQQRKRININEQGK